MGKTRARGPADATLCGHWQLHEWGAAPREQKALRHKWDTGLSGGQSQGSVAFIPLGADTVAQALKQSCGLRLRQGCWWRGGMLQERASPRRPFGHQVNMTLLWWVRRPVFRVSPAPSTKPEGQTKPILPGQTNGLCRIWTGRGQDRGHNGVGVVTASSGGVLPALGCGKSNPKI